MQQMRNAQAFVQAVRALPAQRQREAMAMSDEERSCAEELRLRSGQPMTAVFPDGERPVSGRPVEPSELAQLLEIASRASVHTVLPQLRMGFLTLEGGHRIGLCGRAVMDGGRIKMMEELSSANLRIARQRKGICRPVLDRLCPDGVLEDTLILSPPGMGKTTLLRDLVRAVSQGEGCAPERVALADERGEVAAMYRGTPQLEVGGRTDVMAGCPKAQGLMLLLRSMNPQVMAVDEITAGEDVRGLIEAAGCGVTLLATAHGVDRKDLERRPLYRSMMEEKLFRYLVTICRCSSGRSYQVEELR